MTGDLIARYAEALTHHLTAPSEQTLADAYELGRTAMANGDGLIDLAAAHHHVLVQLSVAKRLDPRVLEASQGFLAEVLSVFEMANRGYRDANEALQARNRELQRANEEVAATSRELETFSYSVSHDLRAPLRNIDGYTEALEQDSSDRLDEVAHGHLKRVRQATRRMSALIDDLLQLARVSRAELKRESVDLSVIARGVIDRLAAAEPERTVEVKLPTHLMARGDARLLGVLLENLLSNAWKFTARRETAHLEVGFLPGTHTYFVHDDGAGFDMKLADRLFVAFARLHTQEEFEGTGVGLATVQRVVRRHGGRIWAEGAVGKGATFYFTLGE